MDESLGDSLTVEPFGFFTLDALRAGWYLMWRQLVRVVPVAVGAVVLAALLGKLGLTVLGVLISVLGILVAVVWAIGLVPQLASRWAETSYGYPLNGSGRVWWGIVWRVFVASLIAGVVLTPPNFVALSLQTAFKGSVLGYLGTLLTWLLGLANLGVSLLATGWAMSRVASEQLSGLPLAQPSFAMPSTPEPPLRTEAPPVDIAQPAARLAPAPAPAAPTLAPPAPVMAAPAPQPAHAPVAVAGKRQCPKCGLYETEMGTVIGWYCTICGWRESRR
jgi:hypothetical protein